MSEAERKNYEGEINAWHTERLDKVKAPNGWLNLAGLFWLKPGTNSFGADSANAIIFPKGEARAGSFEVNGDTVTLHAASENITFKGQPVKDLIIYQPDSSKEITIGSLRFNIIKRDKQLGIRLRDDEAPLQKSFTDIERFPIDPQFRLEASFEKADSLKTIPITNIIGQTTAQKSPGTLKFTWEGKTYSLDALDEKDEFFIIFGDETSAAETYAGGRFLYVKKPKNDNDKVIIDFNKAYNPPCVFTPFATCPLPPKQNRLPIAIRAGEKNFGTHS